MKRHRGFSLVECVVAMGLVVTTFTIAALATGGIQRALARVRADVEIELALERLAIQLRTDAHEAIEADLAASGEPKPPAGTLRLALAGQRRIDYTIVVERIERRVHRGGAVTHRETYRLPESTAAHWELSGEASATVVALKVDPAPAGSARSIASHGVEIQAAVGLLRPLPVEDKP